MMVVTGAIVGAACFAAGWFCHMAWERLYGDQYEDGNDGETTDGES